MLGPPGSRGALQRKSLDTPWRQGLNHKKIFLCNCNKQHHFNTKVAHYSFPKTII